MTKNNHLPRVYNILIYFYLVIIPLAMWPDGHSFNVALSKFVLQAVAGVVLLFFLLLELRKLPTLYQEDKVLLTYFGWMVITSCFAMNVYEAFIGTQPRRDGIITFLLYIAAYIVGKNAKVTNRLLYSTAIGSSLISLFAISQFFQFDPKPLKLYANSWKGLAFGTMGNPNFMASLLVLMLPVCAWLIAKDKKVIGYLSYGLVLFALFASRTRGAWLGGFIGMIVFLVLLYKLQGKAARAKIMKITLLSAAIFLAFNFTSEGVITLRINQTLNDFGKVVDHDSLDDVKRVGTNRYYVWSKSLQLIAMRPIQGFGVENMSNAMYKYFYDDIKKDFGQFLNWDKAHNEYLNIAVSSGIPAVIIWLAFLASVLKKAFKKKKEGCELEVFLIASIIGYMIQAIFNIQMVSVFYAFMAILGLAASNRGCATYEEESSQPELQEISVISES